MGGRLRSIHLVVLLAAVALITVPGVAADSQTWYLEETDHATIGNGVLEMVRGEPNDDDGTVTVSSGDCQTWAAAESAIVDVGYDEDGWSGNFDVQDGDANTNVDYPAHLGHSDHAFNVKELELVDGIVEFTANGAREDSGTISIAEPETGDTFQVPDGHYLTYRFCVDSSEDAITVFTDGSATLSSPGGSPDYPTPEIGTLTLTTAGLLGLAFVGHRRFREGS